MFLILNMPIGNGILNWLYRSPSYSDAESSTDKDHLDQHQDSRISTKTIRKANMPITHYWHLLTTLDDTLAHFEQLVSIANIDAHKVARFHL